MAIYSSGSSGTEVKRLQEALISKGYDVGSSGADGVYGSQTGAAVRKYQQDNGLDVDGVAGDQTLGKLYGTSNSNSNPDSGAGASPGQNQTAAAENKPQYSYDPTADSAYQNALAALQEAQKNLPTYKNTYDSQLQDLYNQITNRDKFSYDINEDALYQQYKDQYVTQGKLAMMDTVGQVANLTGGYGNSYAATAGSQAYQSYLQQLNQVMPELYGQAWERYNQEGQDLLNRYSLLNDRADDEYSKYMDSLNQYWQNLSYQKELADDAYNQGYNNWYQGYQNQYQAERDKISDKQWQDQFDESKRQWQTEFDESRRQYEQQYALSLASRSGGSSGGSYGSGGSSSRSDSSSSSSASLSNRWSGVTSDAEAKALRDQMLDEGYSEDVAFAYYANYLEQNRKSNPGVGTTVKRKYGSSGSGGKNFTRTNFGFK